MTSLLLAAVICVQPVQARPAATRPPAIVATGRVAITGMVSKPGSYALDEPMNLLQLITKAGGMLPQADQAHIVLIRARALPDGKPDAIVFDYTKLFDPKSKVEIPQLRPGDQVVVK